jgi:Do/DeqQ family serine protease
MSSKKLFIIVLIAAFLGGLMSLIGFWWLTRPKTNQRKFIQTENVFASRQINVKIPQGLDFTQASKIALPSVVHIKITYPNRIHFHRQESDETFREFKGEIPKNTPHHSSGSGVLVSEDGYIITNRHVVNGAGTIEVILYDKRSYAAQVIGTDSGTDLALLKIDEYALPYLQYGNSDNLQIGEWVVAIGNPFDLVSTVTAGIVSAKGRRISLLDDNYSVEAFIQTDAAVNPGNSGGALVNLKGELVGINTAIATQTGFFSGYSFAIPINLARKIADDLMNYGENQRAILGVSGMSVNAEIAEKEQLSEVKGVILNGINDGSAAQKANLLKKDVIVMVDNVNINNLAELQTEIALKRPGDIIKITYWRKNKKYSIKLKLLGKNGESVPQKPKENHKQTIKVLGASLRKLSEEEKKQFQLENGVKILSIGKGKMKDCGFRDGFIITQIRGKQMKNVQDIQKMIEECKQKDKSVMIEGVYPNGTKSDCSFGW